MHFRFVQSLYVNFVSPPKKTVTNFPVLVIEAYAGALRVMVLLSTTYFEIHGNERRLMTERCGKADVGKGWQWSDLGAMWMFTCGSAFPGDWKCS